MNPKNAEKLKRIRDALQESGLVRVVNGNTVFQEAIPSKWGVGFSFERITTASIRKKELCDLRARVQEAEKGAFLTVDFPEMRGGIFFIHG